MALRLTETEYQLFYQVPPQEYLRHVAQDQNAQKPPARPPPSPSRSYCNPSTTNSSTQTEEESNWPVPNLFSSVQTLINRFNEVIFLKISSQIRASKVCGQDYVNNSCKLTYRFGPRFSQIFIIGYVNFFVSNVDFHH